MMGRLGILVLAALVASAVGCSAAPPEDRGNSAAAPGHADQSGAGGQAASHGSGQAADAAPDGGPGASTPKGPPPAQEAPPSSAPPVEPASSSGNPGGQSAARATPAGPVSPTSGPEAQTDVAGGPAASGHGPFKEADVPSDASPGAIPGPPFEANPPSVEDETTVAPMPSPVAQIAPSGSALVVTRGNAGNSLSWEIPSPAIEVQVWRQEAEGWVAVTTATEPGHLLDAAGTSTSTYLLTWSGTPLSRGDLLAVAGTLPVLGLDDSSLMGRWLLALLWMSIGAVGFVRGTTRPTGEGVQDDDLLVAVLAPVPGMEPAVLERVSMQGLQTVGQLKRMDVQATAFWAAVPEDLVRRWLEALDLLSWPILPPGVAHGLAAAGHASRTAIAAATPAALLSALRNHAGSKGRLPDEQDVHAWIVEAQGDRAPMTIEVPAGLPQPLVSLR